MVVAFLNDQINQSQAHKTLGVKQQSLLSRAIAILREGLRSGAIEPIKLHTNNRKK